MAKGLQISICNKSKFISWRSAYRKWKSFLFSKKTYL